MCFESRFETVQAGRIEDSSRILLQIAGAETANECRILTYLVFSSNVQNSYGSMQAKLNLTEVAEQTFTEFSSCCWQNVIC